MAQRSYLDACGVARALDRLGERWSLLIVRELLLGPKRFSELARALSGISPNVLSHRLKELEHDGVIEQVTTLPPVSSTAYALTAWGRDLDDVLLALARWGSQAPLREVGVDLSPDALVLSLRTTFDPSSAADLVAAVGLHVEADRFVVSINRGDLAIERGDLDRPDVVLVGRVGAIRSVLYGGVDLRVATGSGDLQVEGRMALARRVVRCFRRPATRVARRS